MSVSFKVEGFRDMERALADLKRTTARAVTRRAMKTALEPVASMAGSLTDDYDIAIGTTLAAHERAQSREDRARSVVTMYVGPVHPDGTHAPEATFDEFGTVPRYHDSGRYVGQILARPFMRPAWDANAAAVLTRLGEAMWAEIEKSVARAARKAARATAKG